MRSPHEVATAAPYRLLVSPGFWRRNRGLVLSVVAGGIFFSLLAQLTWPRGGDPVSYLAPLIQALAILGWIWAVRVAFRMDIDEALARVVERRAADKLGEVKARLVDGVELAALDDLIPRNPHWDRGAIKVFDLVLEEARDRRFRPASTAMRSFRERAVGELLQLQTLRRMALQLGILGTFIGLVLALLTLGDGISAALEHSAIQDLLGSLHTAFSTSIAGLEVTVVLGLVLIALRKRQALLFDRTEAATNSLLSLARRAENPDDYLAEFEQIRTAMRQLGDKVRGQSLAIKNQTTEIESGLGALASVKGDFDAFLEGVRDEQAKVLEEMQSVYQIISPERTARELEASLQRSIDRAGESFRESLGQELAGLEEFREALGELRGLMDEVRERASVQSEQLEADHRALGDAGTRLGELMERTTTLHGEMLERFEETSKLDVERLFDGFESSLHAVYRSLENRLDGYHAALETQAEENRRVAERLGDALERYLSRPTLFQVAIVRPWRLLRGRVAKVVASRS